ncbi:MAG TPA: hypothetical protein VJI67_00100 [archaeon]|nr:hypothetical protein [archaeon]HLD81368.1 hypothetical protein [archaeon]
MRRLRLFLWKLFRPPPPKKIFLGSKAHDKLVIGRRKQAMRERIEAKEAAGKITSEQAELKIARLPLTVLEWKYKHSSTGLSMDEKDELERLRRFSDSDFLKRHRENETRKGNEGKR